MLVIIAWIWPKKYVVNGNSNVVILLQVPNLIDDNIVRIKYFYWND